MARKAEISLGLGLATATVTYAIYQRLPSAADTRVGKPGDDTLESVRKQNAWLAAATVGGISLLAKDPMIFIIGGATLVGLDVLARVNNYTNPISGRIDMNPFVTDEQPVQQTADFDYGGLAAVN